MKSKFLIYESIILGIINIIGLIIISIFITTFLSLSIVGLHNVVITNEMNIKFYSCFLFYLICILLFFINLIIMIITNIKLYKETLTHSNLLKRIRVNLLFFALCILIFVVGSIVVDNINNESTLFFILSLIYSAFEILITCLFIIPEAKNIART